MLPTLKNYNQNIVDRFFGNDLFDSFPGFNFPVIKAGAPAINIAENSDNFRIEVAGPGMKKEDFRIDLDNDLLTISSEKKESSEEKNEKYMRKEFSVCEFKRSFILPDTVDSGRIDASYSNGILAITIPKKEEAKEKEPRQIAIA